LRRPGRQHPPQRLERRPQLGLGAGERREMSRIAGEEEAPFAGLGDADRGHRRVQLLDDVLGRAQALGRELARRERPIGEQGDQRDRDRRQGEAGQCPAGERASGEEGGSQWHAGLRRLYASF
jgi:hypothetical protein